MAFSVGTGVILIHITGVAVTRAVLRPRLIQTVRLLALLRIAESAGRTVVVLLTAAAAAGRIIAAAGQDIAGQRKATAGITAASGETVTAVAAVGSIAAVVAAVAARPTRRNAIRRRGTDAAAARIGHRRQREAAVAETARLAETAAAAVLLTTATAGLHAAIRRRVVGRVGAAEILRGVGRVASTAASRLALRIHKAGQTKAGVGHAAHFGHGSLGIPTLFSVLPLFPSCQLRIGYSGSSDQFFNITPISVPQLCQP
jgi:hypothetical protein